MQGINDLVTPFFEVFLSAYIGQFFFLERIKQLTRKYTTDTDPESFDISHLPESILSAIESDSFWCLTALLNGIQDNYISQQPGIQRLVKRMSELIKRIDAPLATHFEEQGVEFMQFAFRWMNCLLMREISVKCTIRMWDTYLVSSSHRPFSYRWSRSLLMYVTLRLKVQTHFLNSTFTSVQPFS